jgi:FHS family L-fucose permease-like MFS transporter
MIYAGRKMISAAAPPPPHETAEVGIGAMIREAISSPWALFGGLAIFLYVGAEVAIGTQMALFLNSTPVWNVRFRPPASSSASTGAEQWPAGWSAQRYSQGCRPRLLTIFTAAACGLCLFVFSAGGIPGGYAALSIGLFNSIMFPVIFTITLERSTASEEATSGFLVFRSWAARRYRRSPAWFRSTRAT